MSKPRSPRPGRRSTQRADTDAAEQRRERVERLLAGLRKKTTGVNTAAAFDYDAATRIAIGASKIDRTESPTTSADQASRPETPSTEATE
jgi:hypothetical protein